MELRGPDSEAPSTASDDKTSDSYAVPAADSRSRRNTQSKPAQAILPDRSPPLNLNLSNLPPINTSPHVRRTSSQRVPSWSSKRISTLSTTSQHRSRPQSTVFPAFHSSLDYSLVRDFAYPITHPMHYGPPPDDPSGMSTPASEYQRRLSDPPPTTSWTASRVTWATQEPSSADAAFGIGPQLPSTSYRDGPPYSEDDDLHSPIVTSSRHKKTKSSYADYDYPRSRGESGTSQGRRTSYAGMSSDGSQLFYVDHIGEGMADGPGGEYITYPPDNYAWERQEAHGYVPSDENDDISSPEEPDEGAEDSRYSRDYSFTIASPDEEMHGKAVALFDFARENENELPLVEGQVLWVSYRHGQGWLVAQDPRSGESGLVPEEYVRLLTRSATIPNSSPGKPDKHSDSANGGALSAIVRGKDKASISK
ncbi:hypothetical protein FH972_024353 [Carpinus fangiana]|uniref:SH3 domain-containing protein n=1 Tax=Carpinus fangiana TaxID=176857 RepID=A0A5N6L0B5_9ROSI|nr:hypothetical protein FH972_024353 [Carpinus fangiana]